MAVNSTTNINKLANNIAETLLDLPVGTGGTIKTLLQSQSTPTDDKVAITKAQMVDTWRRIVHEILDNLVAEATVRVTVQSHTHTGVTTGPGTSGPPVPGPSSIETGEII